MVDRIVTYMGASFPFFSEQYSLFVLSIDKSQYSIITFLSWLAPIEGEIP